MGVTKRSPDLKPISKEMNSHQNQYRMGDPGLWDHLDEKDIDIY